MNEDKVAIRNKRKETLITVGFSIFSVFLIFITVYNSWSPFIVPVIAAELAFVWWAGINNYKTYEFRAFIITTSAAISTTFYAIHAEHFVYVIPTLCVFAVLFSLHDIVSVYYVVIASSFFIFLSHVFILKTFYIPEDIMELERMALQILSYLVLLFLCLYKIKNNESREKDMESLQQAVTRAQKIKDDFVANTSHELRTPINTITGMSEIVLQEDLSEDIHHDILDIQMTGMELQSIVTDIMDYSALESNTLELNPRSYNITSTLNDIMNMTVFQNREKNLELIFDCDPSIPRLLYGDEAQIRRIINNLIANAIKFTTEGGVRLLVTYRPETYGVNLIVRVKDTGIGMTAAQQENVFQSFYQADSDRNRRVDGMGLGLTISSELVKKMGGFMYVNSKPNEGSEFSFAIPQKIMDERPCIEVDNPSRIKCLWYYKNEDVAMSIRDDYVDHIKKLGDYLKILISRASSLREVKRRIRTNSFSHLIIGVEEYREDPIYFDEIAESMPVVLLADRNQTIPEANSMHILYKPYNAMTLAELFNGGDIMFNPRKYQDVERFVAPDAKVLVVDDNLMNLKVVEGLLRKYRIRISAASSGEEALKIIESKDFDFVFMDHMMPGMDGIECLHAIRSKQGVYYQRVPIIALTANAIAGSREMFLDEGFNDFVAKPIDNTLLNDVLRKYIPKEKQLPELLAQTSTSSKASGNDDVFANMDGIDKKAGLTYCGGSVEDYIEMANIYYGTGQNYFNNLIEYHDNKDWKNYSILTHAIKSTSRTIGATKLSDLAYKEEMASKNEDELAIEQYHDALLNEYRRVLDMIGNNPHIIKQEEEADKVEGESMNEAEWKSFTETLKEKINTFETGSINDLIKNYSNHTYKDKSIKNMIKPVMEKIDGFDFSGALEAFKEIEKEKRAK